MYMYTSHCHVSSSSYVSACAYVCVLLQLYYNEKEAAKYNSSSRIVKVQQELSNRAIELLNLPADQEAFVLDVGCGSGLSGGLLPYAYCFLSSDLLSDAIVHLVVHLLQWRSRNTDTRGSVWTLAEICSKLPRSETAAATCFCKTWAAGCRSVRACLMAASVSQPSSGSATRIRRNTRLGSALHASSRRCLRA